MPPPQPPEPPPPKPLAPSDSNQDSHTANLSASPSVLANASPKAANVSAKGSTSLKMFTTKVAASRAAAVELTVGAGAPADAPVPNAFANEPNTPFCEEVPGPWCALVR